MAHNHRRLLYEISWLVASADGGRADVIPFEMKPSARLSIFQNRDAAVMTNSHDLAEFMRGAQVDITLSLSIRGASIVAPDRSRNGVGGFRIHVLILTTFTAIGNHENMILLSL